MKSTIFMFFMMNNSFSALSGDNLFRFSGQILPSALTSLSEFTEEGGGLKYLTANFFIFGYPLACCFHQRKGLVVWAIEVAPDTFQTLIGKLQLFSCFYHLVAARTTSDCFP